MKISVTPPGGSHCGTDATISFWNSPTVTVRTAAGVSETPTVTAKLTSTCSIDTPNVLVVTFTNSGVFDEPTPGSVTLEITGIKYTVGSTAMKIGTGDVVVGASYSVVTPSSTVAIAATGAANAVIVAPAPASAGGGTSGGGTASGNPATASVTADNPPVTTITGTTDTAISPISIAESGPGQIGAGYVCVALSSGEFDAGVQPTVSVHGGNGETGAATTFEGQTGGAASTVAFKVTKPSTTASTYVVSGLVVDAPSTPGGVDVNVTWGTAARCTDDASTVGTAEAFSVDGTPISRVAGATADGTAAEELEHQFDAGETRCPGSQNSRPVVLATDAGFSDALAASYLAGTLGTGELLTPPGTLSSATEQAIALEGITHVYVVGGVLAVSATVVDQLEAMPVDACGGGATSGPNGSAHVRVTRVYGETAYETAEWVAEYPLASEVGSEDLAGAYAGTNQAGGRGRYNATAGAASSAPGSAGPLPTAILATGRTYQDAESASVLSYADHLPVLLTTASVLSAPAASALDDLGVKQVIVMGGPDAVSDAVVSALEDLGMSVLRVAGRTFGETAVELADLELAPSSAGLGLGWLPTGGVTVARGNYYGDGIAGAAVAADASPASAGSTAHPEPLLLTDGPGTVGPYLTAFLVGAGVKGVDDASSAKVHSLTVLGGTDAVTVTSAEAMLADL